MKTSPMPPAGSAHPHPAPVANLRHWFAQHRAKRHPATQIEPTSPNLASSSQSASRTTGTQRAPASSRYFALVSCVSVAALALGASILWPHLQTEPPALPKPMVAQTKQRESGNSRSPALPPSWSGTTVAFPMNPPPQPINPEVPDLRFLRPGESVAAVHPDGLLIESLGQQGSKWTGLRKITFDRLPESVRRRYGYDPQKATQYAAEQARWMANYRAQCQQAASADDTAELDRQKMEVLAALVSDYHKSHTYSLEDKFVCADMACDVWNMVRTKGFPAKIQIGNVERDISSVTEADHAWVLADVSHGKWLALETTAGRVVFQAENPRYYAGWSFENPKKYKEFCCQHSYTP